MRWLDEPRPDERWYFTSRRDWLTHKLARAVHEIVWIVFSLVAFTAVCAIIAIFLHGIETFGHS